MSCENIIMSERENWKSPEKSEKMTMKMSEALLNNTCRENIERSATDKDSETIHIQAVAILLLR